MPKTMTEIGQQIKSKKDKLALFKKCFIQEFEAEMKHRQDVQRGYATAKTEEHGTAETILKTVETGVSIAEKLTEMVPLFGQIVAPIPKAIGLSFDLYGKYSKHKAKKRITQTISAVQEEQDKLKLRCQNLMNNERVQILVINTDKPSLRTCRNLSPKSLRFETLRGT